MTLAQQHVQPIHGETAALAPNELLELAREVPGWTVEWEALERDYHFKDFEEAIGFVNMVAKVAEKEQHHPDIRVSYNQVHLAVSTHEIGGLTKNDFILAAKISELA